MHVIKECPLELLNVSGKTGPPCAASSYHPLPFPSAFYASVLLLPVASRFASQCPFFLPVPLSLTVAMPAQSPSQTAYVLIVADRGCAVIA